MRDPVRLNRYRFGLMTADYLVCGTCGVYLGAVYQEAGASWLLINSHALTARDAFTQTATVVDYDTETEPARRARRKAAWTPTSFDPPSVMEDAPS